MLTEGFDVSKWQNPKKWNWAALKARGVKFMVARASYGKGLADPTFVRYAELIRANGIVFSAYLFYRQIHSVEEQLALFERQLSLVGGLQNGDMFPGHRAGLRVQPGRDDHRREGNERRLGVERRQDVDHQRLHRQGGDR